MNRVARVDRLTSETQVLVELDLDGAGVVDVTTRVPFFDSWAGTPAST
jgi:imidazoleglycerol-phosphate dehydratase